MSEKDYGGEQVLVVPTLLFHELGVFQGFSAHGLTHLETLLDPQYTRFLARSTAETDPSFKQLIPYCLFECNGQLLHYRRGGGGEGRLLGKRSLGIGGHISADDAAGASHPYQVGMRREIEEEILIDAEFSEQLVGMINDDSSEVGRVHLGIVHLFRLDLPKVSPREQSINELAFALPDQLLDEIDEFETWSQICLKQLAEICSV